MSVSVIMTCHNEASFIEQAVHSVAAQTAFDQVHEIVVVDDGSRDASPEILKRLSTEIERLRVIETPCVGLPAARNHALREAKGEFVAILDGDDYWTPEKLERQLPAFDRGRQIGLVYGEFVHLGPDGAQNARTITVRPYDPENPEQLREYFVHDGPIVPSTAVIRREVFDDVGLMDESLRTHEDAEFFLRLAERWRLCHVPGAFTVKRQHPGQITHKLDALLADVTAVTQRFSDRHPELKPLAGRRLARFRVKASVDYLMKGDWRNAIGHGVAAIRIDPRYWRAWANLALVLLPPSLIRPFYDGLKGLWHAVRRRRRRA